MEEILSFISIIASIVLGLIAVGIISQRADKKEAEGEISIQGYNKLRNMCDEFTQLTEMANDYLGQSGKSLGDKDLTISIKELRNIAAIYGRLVKEREMSNAKMRIRELVDNRTSEPKSIPEEPEEPEEHEEMSRFTGNRFEKLELT